jgi:tripartite-type tricarboxylate transporter receptor subunit TctC
MTSRRMFRLGSAAWGLGGLASGSLAYAQSDYHSRVIRIVVANPPGGDDDTLTPFISEAIAPDLGRPLIVENRGGAATTIGAVAVSLAPPDGYTLLCLHTAALVQTVLRENLKYSLKSFTPIIKIGGYPMALVVPAASKIRTIDDAKTLATTKDGIAYATAGAGTMAHLTTVRFLKAIGGHGLHVTYKNNPEGMQSLVGGYTQMMFVSAREGANLQGEGLLRVLATTSSERTNNLPEVATMRELGLPPARSSDDRSFPLVSSLPAVKRVRCARSRSRSQAVSPIPPLRALAEQLCGFIVDPAAHNIRQLERSLFHAVQDATARVCFEIFTYTGRVTLVRLLREASRLAQAGGAVRWLDAMSQATGMILQRDGLIDQAHAGLFYASVQEMKADMLAQRVDLANLTIEDVGLFASPDRAVRLTTIHNSKGREYGAVALINLREGRFPHFRAEDMDAERRLFYVAVRRNERHRHSVQVTDRSDPCVPNAVHARFTQFVAISLRRREGDGARRAIENLDLRRSGRGMRG